MLDPLSARFLDRQTPRRFRGMPRIPLDPPSRLFAIIAVLLASASCHAASASAQTSKEAIEKSIRNGVVYLRTNVPKNKPYNETGLAAYAMIKAGESPEEETVAKLLELVVKKTEGGSYQPTGSQFYEAGVDIMALESAMHATGDKERYLKEIEMIVQYIVQGQSIAGSWFYPTQPDTGGDTSITQYALLGLWAAHRAGVKVPNGCFERAAAWHIRNQQAGGEFVYHPGGGGPSARDSMTVNGIASLCVARLMLYPKGDYTLPEVPDLLPPQIQAIRANQDDKNGNSESATGDDKKGRQRNSGKRNSGGQGGAKGNKDSAVGTDGIGAANNAAADGKPEKPKKRWGILIPVDVGTGDRVEEKSAKTQSAKSEVRGAGVALADLNFAIARGVNWLTEHYRISGIDGWPIYYHYGLERASALTSIEKYKDHDWYQEGAEFLMGIQQQDGRFPGHLDGVEGTSFALLFLSNATRSLFTPDGKPRISVGGGLLVGNRGLPENLSEINTTAEGAQARKITGPVDELLAELENPKNLKVEEVQAAVVEKVQLGDREALVGQRERLLRLVEDPRIEVRRTVLWALGRCSLVVDAPIFIRALDDPDVSVVVEANNALSWLSRRPGGIGLPSDPLASVEEGATEEQKLAAITKWREGLRQGWTKWFASIQPYKDREFLPAPRTQ